MSDTANTFQSLQPMYKDVYAKKIEDPINQPKKKRRFEKLIKKLKKK